MRNLLLVAMAVIAPVAGFCWSSMTCRELDVNNQIMRLQNCGYHIISTRNLTPYSLPCDAIWEIVYE